MRLTTCLTASLALYGTIGAASAAAPAKFQLKQTTWTFVDNKTKVQESINERGIYVENAVSGKHIDHGTAVMKGGKACFTSAMNKKGEICWTTKPVKIGQSMTTTNDKGEKLKVTRVKYAPVAGY
jgi:hypothetical protein